MKIGHGLHKQHFPTDCMFTLGFASVLSCGVMSETFCSSHHRALRTGVINGQTHMVGFTQQLDWPALGDKLVRKRVSNVAESYQEFL